MVLGDFYPGSNHLVFGTVEGLFYYNTTTGNITKIWSSGYAGNMSTYFGYPIVYMDGSAGSPMMVYADSNIGFAIKSSIIGSACGDGVCNAYENAFTCANDCVYSGGGGTLPEGTVTENASLCLTGYVEYGKCALKPKGITCNADTECLANSCVDSLCQDVDIWTGINNAKNQFWGDTTGGNDFISLIIILGGAIGLGSILGVWASLGWIVLGVIFFTMVGWLSAFFIVGLFLIGLIIIVLGITIGSKG